MSDLLKEAIADAKAVRETALQNAKIALEEAFTPRIKSMLSAKLREDEDELGDEELPVEDEEEIGGEEDLGGEEEIPADEMAMDELEDEEEVPAEEPELEAPAEEDEFGGEEEVPLEEPGEDEVEETIELNGKTYRLVSEEEEESEEPAIGGDDDDDDDDDDDLDLEAVIRELETELKEEEEGDDDDETVDEQSETSAIGTGDNNLNPADGGDQEDAESGVVIDDNDDDASALSASGKSVTETTYEISSNLLEGDDDDDDDDDDDTVDEETEMGVVDDNDDDAKPLNASGNSVTEELKEYKEAVKFLKDKLHEVNILNAKLLYTNKLFREFILDNGQKMKVVETFDRAQTVREIKLVYATLAESFQGGNVKRKNSLKESASAKSGSTRPSKKSQKVITEEAKVADRFRKLAGLK